MAKVSADPSVTIPPTNPPAEPANEPVKDVIIDPRDEVIEAYKQQLLAESRRGASLAQENERLRSAPQTPPAANVEPTDEEEQEFFKKPVSTIKRLVKAEVESTVRPLNAFTANIERNNVIERAKEQMRGNPSAFPYISIPEVESYMDQMIASAKGLDANIFVLAYNTAVGYAISNGVELKKGATPTTPSNRSTSVPSPTPPYVRPTAPAPVNAPGAKKLRALSEAERKIARFNKMTDAEYILFTDGENSIVRASDEDIKKHLEAK